MNAHGSRAGYVVCLIAALIFANAVQAQSTTATPTKAPQTTTAPPAD